MKRALFPLLGLAGMALLVLLLLEVLQSGSGVEPGQSAGVGEARSVGASEESASPAAGGSQGSLREPVEGNPELPVTFASGGSRERLTAAGELRLARRDRRGFASRVENGVALPPAGLDPKERLYLVGIELGGRDYTYLDLDATWEELAARSPVEVVPGEPVPARLLTEQGVELPSPVRLGPPLVSGRTVGGEYRDLDAIVGSPIALPHRGSGHRVELSAESAWGRPEVPAPPHQPAVGVELVPFVLRRTFDLEVILHARERMTGLTLTLTPDPAGSAETLEPAAFPTENRGALVVRIDRSAWLQGPTDWILPKAFEDVLPGRYTAEVLEVRGVQGLVVSPPVVPVGPDAPDRVELWLEGGEAATAVNCRIHLRFPLAIEDVRTEVPDGIDVTLRVLAAEQVAGGQSPALRMPLWRLARSAIYDRTVVLQRQDGLAAGEYELVVRPLGFVRRLVIDPATWILQVDVPPLGRVLLVDGDRASSVEEPAAGGGFPRVTPEGFEQPPTEPPPVNALGEEPGSRTYLLAYGEYALSSIGPRSFVRPDGFLVGQPEATVTFHREPGCSRLLVWELAGKRIGLPLSVLQKASLFQDGESVRDSIVAAGGYELATGEMQGLLLTVREPGTYSVVFTLTLPGIGTVERSVDELEIARGEQPPFVHALDP